MKFLTTGTKTTKNVDAMEEVMKELVAENLYVNNEKETKKKKSKKN